MGVIKPFLNLLPYGWALRWFHWLHLHRMRVSRCGILHVSRLRTLRFETVSQVMTALYGCSKYTNLS